MSVKWERDCLKERTPGRWLSKSGHLQPHLTTCIQSSYPRNGKRGSIPKSGSLDNKHKPMHDCVSVVQKRVGEELPTLPITRVPCQGENSACSCGARIWFAGCRIKRQKLLACPFCEPFLPKVTYMLTVLGKRYNALGKCMFKEVSSIPSIRDKNSGMFFIYPNLLMIVSVESFTHSAEFFMSIISTNPYSLT